VNSVRSDSNVDEITMPGTGFLAFYDKDTSSEVMPPAGFTWAVGNVWDWEDVELETFYKRENTHFLIVDSTIGNVSGVCGEDAHELLHCEGGCYLTGLPASAVTRWQKLINATRRLGGGQRVLVYQNSGIDSSEGASVRHADSAITDAHGQTVAYRSCAAGKDYPLFFANTTNSYGKILEAVYQKVLDPGFNGVYQLDYPDRVSQMTDSHTEQN
jgi:hypothetical protein